MHLSRQQKSELRRQCQDYELIVNLSGGKDSLAMLHVVLEAGIQPAANLYYDGGWDFPYMSEHLEQIEHIAGVKITVIRPKINFDFSVRVKK